DLMDKTLIHDVFATQEIDSRTPNWDKDRIAELDLMLIKMGITEFLHFPTIPVRVTINEYIEIAKEYSTPKSSIFINGIMDKIVKDFEIKGMLNKSGRGTK
ncbi:MAG TPA: transcription antitermination protein NusB, partial [Flavobacteriaceae bacterium]|nr:transcription antitermination protein NusB [Flavobacteriaceae bacterium]